MVSHGYEHEERRRREAGIPTLRWYKCHECGWEHAYGAMAGICGNCGYRLNIHSDLDGEKPTQL